MRSGYESRGFADEILGIVAVAVVAVVDRVVAAEFADGRTAAVAAPSTVAERFVAAEPIAVVERVVAVASIEDQD